MAAIETLLQGFCHMSEYSRPGAKLAHLVGQSLIRATTYQPPLRFPRCPISPLARPKVVAAERLGVVRLLDARSRPGVPPGRAALDAGGARAGHDQDGIGLGGGEERSCDLPPSVLAEQGLANPAGRRGCNEDDRAVAHRLRALLGAPGEGSLQHQGGLLGCVAIGRGSAGRVRRRVGLLRSVRRVVAAEDAPHRLLHLVRGCVQHSEEQQIQATLHGSTQGRRRCARQEGGSCRFLSRGSAAAWKSLCKKFVAGSLGGVPQQVVHC